MEFNKITMSTSLLYTWEFKIVYHPPTSLSIIYFRLSQDGVLWYQGSMTFSLDLPETLENNFRSWYKERSRGKGLGRQWNGFRWDSKSLTVSPDCWELLLVYLLEVWLTHLERLSSGCLWHFLLRDHWQLPGSLAWRLLGSLGLTDCSFNALLKLNICCYNS